MLTSSCLFDFPNQERANRDSTRWSLQITILYGRHTCPGRFFAVNEIKMMLAHVILTYDVRFGGGQKRPPSMWHNQFVFPDPTKEVLFQTRVC